MSESEQTRALKNMLRKLGVYSLKIHQSGYQERGIPDLLCCVQGVFVGIEVKVVYGHTLRYTEHQLMHLTHIREAGGLGIGVAYNPGEHYGVRWAIDEKANGETHHLTWMSLANLAESVRSLPERMQATQGLSVRTTGKSQLNPVEDYLSS